VSTPEITAVIVSWNSGESLPASLGALRRSAESAGAPVEIVVVDNASADESVRIAAAAGVDRIVENPLNAGYVVAASQGVALARGRWIMLANPDLTVDEGFVRAILEVAQSAGSDVACLVPDIRYAADPSVVNSRGLEVDEIGIPAERDAGRPADRLVGPVEVFGPTSSGCLIRRDALAAVGGLEPLYFAYLEDVDVAWRLRRKGYRTLVVPGAVALHEGSASTGEGSWLKAFLVARNRRVLFRLHGPHGLGARALRTVTEIGHASVQALSGGGTASVRGRVAALRTRPYTRYLRASIRSGNGGDASVALAPRQTLQEALRRKQAAASLMKRGAAGKSSTAVRVRGRAARLPRSALPSRRLKVLVDATNLKPGQGGIRTYTVGLIRALAERSELSLVVAASVEEVADLGPLEFVRVSPQTQGVVARALWRERNLVSLAGTSRVDVTLTPVPELPLRGLPVPSVIVVHDVGPLVAPAFYSLPKRLRYQAFLPRTCRLASAIVCVSEATLLGLRAVAGIDPRRCAVIGEGPQLLGKAAEPPPSARPYLLYVGSLDARKNVGTLLDALAARDAATDVDLLIVGPAEERAVAGLRRRVHRLGLEGRVRHLGFVPPEQLTALYRGAAAVALPSLYEGFGLPVLEAMQSGTPVVASDIAPVREVAGDAALYVSNPLDVDAWRAALARICEDSAVRADLSRRGVEAAMRFAWADVGRRFSDLLHRVAASGALVVPAPPGPGTAAVGARAPAVPRSAAGLPAGAESKE
jgi:GT2 family glycosyltransferase/glycosyltransferase involved in cell wall biosynthesis